MSRFCFRPGVCSLRADVVCYVSGHGYGHATRTNAIVRALLQMDSNLQVAVRTAAPAMLFESDVRYSRVAVEGSIVETRDALAVDTAASAASLREFLSRSDQFIASELQFLRDSRARLIVGDIPFIAGELARRTGIQAVAAGNFLWHWILAECGDCELIEMIRDGYRGYTRALRLPFSHSDEWDVFPQTTDVPLVTPRGGRPRNEVRRELGLTKTAVLLGGRGTLEGDALARVRSENPEFEFVLPSDGPVYSDLLRASDVVAAKIGYSIAAECIAEEKRLLYPPRSGFREEGILRREVPRFMPAAQIPVIDWAAGNWRPYLQRLLEIPRPQATMPADGASVCARAIASLL